VITPGAGCSITSTAAGSTIEATGRFPVRAAFFTGARLALATAPFVAFARAALESLRAFPRVADFPRSFPLFCTFDLFLRLAMIPPGLVGAPMPDQKTTGQVRQLTRTSYQQMISPTAADGKDLGSRVFFFTFI
jgi:hypothetical protein